MSAKCEVREVWTSEGRIENYLVWLFEWLLGEKPISHHYPSSKINVNVMDEIIDDNFRRWVRWKLARWNVSLKWHRLSATSIISYHFRSVKFTLHLVVAGVNIWAGINQIKPNRSDAVSVGSRQHEVPYNSDIKYVSAYFQWNLPLLRRFALAARSISFRATDSFMWLPSASTGVLGYAYDKA